MYKASRGAIDCFTVLAGFAVTAGAFVGGVWAWLGLAGGPMLYAVTAWRIKGWPRLPQDNLLLIGAALTIIALLNIFSGWPDTSWTEWIRLASIFIPLTLFPLDRLNTPPPVLRRRFRLLAVLAMAGALSLSLELYGKGVLLHIVNGPNAPLTQYNRGLSYLVVMSFALLAGVQRFENKKPKAINFLTLGLIVTLLIATGLTESRAAKMAFIAGLIVTGVASYYPILVTRILAVLPVFLCAWPFVVQTLFIKCFDRLAQLPDSWRARVEIWDYMSYRIMEHPWLGWGLGSSSLLPFAAPHGNLYNITLSAAAHPHNVVTQLWVELGVPGLLLGLAFAWLVLTHIGRLDRRLIPYACGAWMAALCLSLVAYNFWTDSLFACFALTGYAFRLLEDNAMRKSRDSAPP